MRKFILTMLSVLIGCCAHADVPAISPGSQQEGIANVANSIFSVSYLHVGKYAYQIVSMDSKLNGDLALTTIVLVGENEVGGEAGYEAAFQLTPTKDLRSLDSAKVTGPEISFTFDKMDGTKTIKTMHYDPKTKTLIGN